MKHLTSLSLILFLARSRCLPQSQESGDSLPQTQESGDSLNQSQVDEELQVVSRTSIKIGDQPPLGDIGAPLLATAAFFYFYFDKFLPKFLDAIYNIPYYDYYYYADAFLTMTIQALSSPLHFLLQYIPPSIADLIPQQVRTGPVGATVGLVLLAVGVFYTSTILYYIGYIIGKYILANIVFPNSVERIAEKAAKAGRSLLSDPVALDNLHQGVLKAVDKYNQLQETYWEY